VCHFTTIPLNPREGKCEVLTDQSKECGKDGFVMLIYGEIGESLIMCKECFDNSKDL